MGRFATRGFTLFEQLIVLAITSVLVLTGMPSFSRLMARGRVQSAGSELALSFAQARIRAVTDQSSYSLCASRDGRTCARDTRWDEGWIIFTDPHESGVPAPGSIVDRVAHGSDGPLIRSTAGRIILSFRRDGTSAGNNVTMLVCDPAQGVARKIIVSNVGRARTEPMRDGDTACTSLHR